MRVPLSWLRERVDVGLPPAELARALSRSGTLVEEVHTLGVPAIDVNLDRFRVGRVVSVVCVRGGVRWVDGSGAAGSSVLGVR